ncbi:MAG: DinB family protein [Acidimicrobiia bacterium]|nr:DinB family protein [Acidimicrobiia bacterium]
MDTDQGVSHAARVPSTIVLGPTTSLPEDTDRQDGERATLQWFLDYFRAVLVRKAEGVTEEQARLAACPPSDMTLLGLVRHMADVERHWFGRALPGVELPSIYYGDAHPDGDEDGDFHPPPGATVAEALATHGAEIAAADVTAAGFELDDVERAGRQQANLRWIMVHMIEEYARHCGHADLLRQAIDGATGD